MNDGLAVEKAGTLLAVNGAVPVRFVVNAGLWSVYELSNGGFACYREGKAEHVATAPGLAVNWCIRRVCQINDLLGKTPGGN